MGKQVTKTKTIKKKVKRKSSKKLTKPVNIYTELSDFAPIDIKNLVSIMESVIKAKEVTKRSYEEAKAFIDSIDKDFLDADTMKQFEAGKKSYFDFLKKANTAEKFLTKFKDIV